MIYIPSYRRSERLMNRINTLQWISEEHRKQTWLVVREDDVDAYNPVVDHYRVGLVVIPSEAYDNRFFGWGDTMDWIVNYASKFSERFIIMDDDLKLAYRPDLEVAEWKPFTEEIFDAAMATLLTTSMDIPYMGLRERQFSDAKKTEYEDGSRFIHIFSFYAPFFIQHPEYRYRNTDQRFMTDLKMLLTLLTNGVTTRTWNRYVHDDVPDADGGCSTMRTVEGYNESAIQLYRAFPDFVSLRQKTNWGDTRIGTMISWKKARAYGQR